MGHKRAATSDVGQLAIGRAVALGRLLRPAIHHRLALRLEICTSGASEAFSSVAGLFWAVVDIVPIQDHEHIAPSQLELVQ